MRHFYRPRHAAPYNAQTARAATTLADVYQPRHAAPEQPEYTPRHLEPVAPGVPPQPNYEVTALAYTGHGMTHGSYRADVAL